MLAIIIILSIIVFVELIICLFIHADRKKTHEVYLFMSEMVSNQGGALQKSLEELKESSKYADPSESAAAISEIVRFLESFNETVRKQVIRIEEAQKNKWHKSITGIFKKKKTSYTLPSKKKDEEKAPAPSEEKESEEKEDSELNEIDEKIEKKLSETELKPKKKIRKIKKLIKKPKVDSKDKKEESDKDKAVSESSDTDIDLAPPPEG